MNINRAEYDEWCGCRSLAQGTGWSPFELTRLGREVLDTSGCRSWKSCRKVIELGKQEYDGQHKTVCFITAVNDMLKSKAHLRPSSLLTLEQTIRRMLRMMPELAKKKVRSITLNYCKVVMDTCFVTPRQRKKGRSVLSVILGHACRRGWCDRNIVSGIDMPHIQEQRIQVLNVKQCEELLRIAGCMFKGSCLPAVALMMFAGLRPTETARLKWEDIKLDERWIVVSPRHSKTGGGRCVSILPPLARILQPYCSKLRLGRIVPPSWTIKWRQIHHAFHAETGCAWQADVLRHGFASYFAVYFKDSPRLQMEMGHSSAALLRTRYLCCVSPSEAEAFWNIGEKGMLKN